MLGETGARPSQAVRLRVRDLITIDAKAPRLMMPKSGKGGTRHPGQRKVERYAVSISPELAALLKLAAKGRPSNAALLLRKNGKPWNEDNPSNDYRRDVRSVVESIGLDPDVYGLYAFRHTVDHPHAARWHPHGNCRQVPRHQRGDDPQALCRVDPRLHRRDHAQDTAVARTGARACREQRRSAGETVSAVQITGQSQCHARQGRKEARDARCLGGRTAPHRRRAGASEGRRS